jgi:hypothetical protein
LKSKENFKLLYDLAYFLVKPQLVHHEQLLMLVIVQMIYKLVKQAKLLHQNFMLLLVYQVLFNILLE